jgi:hypothetical protein
LVEQTVVEVLPLSLQILNMIAMIVTTVDYHCVAWDNNNCGDCGIVAPPNVNTFSLSLALSLTTITYKSKRDGRNPDRLQSL